VLFADAGVNPTGRGKKRPSPRLNSTIPPGKNVEIPPSNEKKDSQKTDTTRRREVSVDNSTDET